MLRKAVRSLVPGAHCLLWLKKTIETWCRYQPLLWRLPEHKERNDVALALRTHVVASVGTESENCKRRRVVVAEKSTLAPKPLQKTKQNKKYIP